jgi:hypothetical protein
MMVSQTCSWSIKRPCPGIYKKFKDREDYNSPLTELKNHLFAINEGFEKAGLNLDEANSLLLNA